MRLTCSPEHRPTAREGVHKSTTLAPSHKMKEWLKFGGKVILVLAVYRVAKQTVMSAIPADSAIRTFLNNWLP